MKYKGPRAVYPNITSFNFNGQTSRIKKTIYKEEEKNICALKHFYHPLGWSTEQHKIIIFSSLGQSSCDVEHICVLLFRKSSHTGLRFGLGLQCRDRECASKQMFNTQSAFGHMMLLGWVTQWALIQWVDQINTYLTGTLMRNISAAFSPARNSENMVGKCINTAGKATWGTFWSWKVRHTYYNMCIASSLKIIVTKSLFA